MLTNILLRVRYTNLRQYFDQYKYTIFCSLFMEFYSTKIVVLAIHKDIRYLNKDYTRKSVLEIVNRENNLCNQLFLCQPAL